MKKQYISPSVTTVEMGATHSILTGSNIVMSVQNEEFVEDTMNTLAPESHWTIWNFD